MWGTKLGDVLYFQLELNSFVFEIMDFTTKLT